MIAPRNLTAAGLILSCFVVTACDNTTGTSARVHVGVGYSPFWRYYDRDIIVPPGPGGPDIELPIAPPPIAVPLPSFPEPDFGGGFGGDFGGDIGIDPF